jgi:hypothetical protein
MLKVTVTIRMPPGVSLALAAGLLAACATPSREGAPGAAPAGAAPSRPFVVQDAAPLLAGLPDPGGQVPPARDPGADLSTFWNRLTAELGSASRFAPPRQARAYALVHVAIHDALWVAQQGDPAGRHPRAVAAGAASTVLSALFDRERDRIAGEARMQVAGDPAPDRALELGHRVGALLVEHGRPDGYEPFDDTPLPEVKETDWTGMNAILPGAGSWKLWWLDSPEEFPAEPPHALGSEADLRDLAEVEAVAARRTPRQILLARKWAETSPPTLWNEILTARIARDRPPPLAAARAYVYLNTAMHDAFVSCWHTKYRYMVARPFQRQPSLRTVVPTPNFPSYTSGHATISGAAAEVLGALYPAESAFFQQQAEEAAESRLWGGIHFRHDNEAGLAVGRKIGQKVAGIMRRRGAL